MSTHLRVEFEVPNDGPRMLRNLPAAKRALRRAAKVKGLRVAEAVPLPHEAGMYRHAAIDGRFRVIVGWVPYPLYGEPRYIGLVDALVAP